MGRVWDSSLSPNLRLVLLAYADAAEHDGTDIWPGWERISTMTGYSQPTVARLTAELKALGVLVQVGKGHTGRRAEYRIDLDHASMRAYQDDIQSESESLSNDAESVSNQAESLSPVIPLPSFTPVLPSHPKKRSPDLLWESFVEIHGQPATKSERGKYNRAVANLREADVTPDEYPALVAAFTMKNNGLQGAPMTIAERVGELRHFVNRGPIRTASIDDALETRRDAELLTRQESEQRSLT